MPTTISNFTHIRPDAELDQKESIEWLAAVHCEASKKGVEHGTILAQLRKIGLGEQKIQKRGICVPDCYHQNWEEMEIFHASQENPQAGFGKRGEFYDRITTDMFSRFYPEGNKFSPNLVHVTCTGYVAPSPAQRVASLRGAETVVTHAYHMGCYASIPALRIARGFKGDVDIVHTELCTLHLNPLLHQLEQLVVQTLFADGFIKYTVKEAGGAGLRILALDERLIPDSSDSMHWVCQDWGLKMKLAKDVPVLIARALPSFVAHLLTYAGVKAGSDIFYAIHPGGPKIIQQVAKILDLKPQQFEHSLWVLQNYGNMSSATLPHIWEKLWKDEKIKDGSYIVSLGFGPGLTLAGGVFQCVR